MHACRYTKQLLTFRDMRAVMIRLDTPGRIISVDMERVQVCADLLDRGEVLGYTGTCLEDMAFGSERDARDVIGVGGDVRFGLGHFEYCVRRPSG